MNRESWVPTLLKNKYLQAFQHHKRSRKAIRSAKRRVETHRPRQSRRWLPAGSSPRSWRPSSSWWWRWSRLWWSRFSPCRRSQTPSGGLWGREGERGRREIWIACHMRRRGRGIGGGFRKRRRRGVIPVNPDACVFSFHERKQSFPPQGRSYLKNNPPSFYLNVF